MTFHDSQNDDYFNVCRGSVQGVFEGFLFAWLEQIIGLMKQGNACGSVNDIGCNMGTFYKGILSHKLPLDYCGIDHEPRYLDEARKFFPEAKFMLLDIENGAPPVAKYTVLNAVLEHLDDPVGALRNVLVSTERCVYLRTFLGETFMAQTYHKPEAQLPYSINQFAFSQVMGLFNDYGFNVHLIRDSFSDSLPQLIVPGIVRTCYIVVGQRRAARVEAA